MFGFLKFEKSGKEASIKVKLNIDKSSQSEILFKDGNNMLIEDINSMEIFSPLVSVSGVKFNPKSFYIIMDLCGINKQKLEEVQQLVVSENNEVSHENNKENEQILTEEDRDKNN